MLHIYLQEVGVDHIFVRAHSQSRRVAKATANAISPYASTSRRRTKTRTYADMLGWKGGMMQQSVMDGGLGWNGGGDLSDALSGHNAAGLQVVHSLVSPPTLPDDRWPDPDSFDLSDHRPVTATIRLEKRSASPSSVGGLLLAAAAESPFQQGEPEEGGEGGEEAAQLEQARASFSTSSSAVAPVALEEQEGSSHSSSNGIPRHEDYAEI